MNSEQLYFIAVPIEGELALAVRGLQQELSDRFHVSRQLKIPPHITLIPPFRADADFVAKLKALLDEFSNSKESFNINTSGFSHFNGKVIFVNVEHSLKLKSLQFELAVKLKEELSFSDTYSYPEFIPHITLANRDMDAASFARIWPELTVREFFCSYKVDRLVIYEQRDKLWVPASFFALL